MFYLPGFSPPPRWLPCERVAASGCSAWCPPSQAKTSGKFSPEELAKLWREFLHHRDKVHEYNVLLDTLSRAEGASGALPSPSRSVLTLRAVGGARHALSQVTPAL